MTTQATIRTTNGRGRLFDSILDTVGDTPVIRINNLAPDHVKIYVKAEFFNPASSVKDRVMGKLSGKPSSDKGYNEGEKGILSSSDGKKLDLSGGGLKAKVTKQVCDQILAQGKSLL